MKRTTTAWILLGVVALSANVVDAHEPPQIVYEVHMWKGVANNGWPTEHLPLLGGPDYYQLEVWHNHSSPPLSWSTNHWWYGTAQNPGGFEVTNGSTPYINYYYYDGNYTYALCSIVEFFTQGIIVSDVWVSTGAGFYDDKAYVYSDDLGYYTVPLIFEESL